MKNILIILLLAFICLSSINKNNVSFYVPKKYFESVQKGDTNSFYLKPVRMITYMDKTFFLDAYKCYDLYDNYGKKQTVYKDSIIYKITYYPTLVCKEDLVIDTEGFWNKGNEIFIVTYKNKKDIKLVSKNPETNQRIIIDYVLVSTNLSPSFSKNKTTGEVKISW